MDRRFNSRAYAKRETGLKTNDLDALMAAVLERMNAAIAECDVREGA